MPDLLGLLLAIAQAEPVMVEHLPYDIFAHPHGKVRRNDAHNGNIRNLRIVEDMIDTGAEREDHLEVGQTHEGSRPLLPHQGIANFFLGRISIEH
jgi:hypothetical protein